MHAVALGVAEEEVAPEAAGPLLHFAVGAGGQVDGPKRREKGAVFAEGRRLQPLLLLFEEAEELLEPALFVDSLVGAGPATEFFAVVGQHEEARPLAAPPLAEEVNGSGGRLEGDQVAQLFADGKDVEGAALLLGAIVAVQLLDAGILEMGVVHDGVMQPGGGDGARQVGLPDPLGQPHPAGCT